MPAPRVVDTLWHSDAARLVPSGHRYELLFKTSSSGMEKTVWLNKTASIAHVLAKVTSEDAAAAIVQKIAAALIFCRPFHVDRLHHS